MTKTLVTGGVRCGKSRWAEECVRVAAGDAGVTYVTPGYLPDAAVDPEWAARVAAHRLARPAHWTTVETADVAAALRAHDGVVLVDCIGTWLTRQLDAAGWDSPRADVVAVVERAIAALAEAVADHPGTVVLVTNEVGWGLVSEHASGRLFADLLGRANQALGRVVDDVVLLVAGRALTL